MADDCVAPVWRTWADVTTRLEELATIIRRLPGYHRGEVTGLVPLSSTSYVPAAWLAGRLELELLLPAELRAGCVLLGTLAAAPGPKSLFGEVAEAQTALDELGRNVASVLFLYRREGAPYILTTEDSPAGADLTPEGVLADLGPAAYPLEAQEVDATAPLHLPWATTSGF